MNELKIISLNPGATSTKVGYFIGAEQIFAISIEHSLEELAVFEKINDQFDFRLEAILKTLTEHQVDLTEIDGIAARGGILPPVKGGAYEINQAMLSYLSNLSPSHHASNLGALLAEALKKEAQATTRAFIYDAVSVDEMHPIARVSGLKGMERESLGHILNMRGVAQEISRQIKQDYQALTFIVAHLGGGNTISLHRQGKIIDLLSDDEGPFSTERTGELPLKQVINWAYRYTKEEMMVFYRHQGGMISYLGTNDGREVEKRIAAGDKEAELVYRALAYQVAKGIGSLATIVAGEIDGIIITGGLAKSKLLMADIKKRVSFLGKVYLVPGERELISLAAGVRRVMLGQEKSHTFYLKN